MCGGFFFPWVFVFFLFVFRRGSGFWGGKFGFFYFLTHESVIRKKIIKDCKNEMGLCLLLNFLLKCNAYRTRFSE